MGYENGYFVYKMWNSCLWIYTAHSITCSTASAYFTHTEILRIVQVCIVYIYIYCGGMVLFDFD